MILNDVICKSSGHYYIDWCNFVLGGPRVDVQATSMLFVFAALHCIYFFFQSNMI